MARGQGQIGPNIAGIIREPATHCPTIRGLSQARCGKARPPCAAPPRSEQLRPSLILTNIPILCSLWLYRSEVLCALASGLTATGRAGPTPGGGPAPRWWLTQLCLLAITHLSSTGHQGQQRQPYKRNPTPRVMPSLCTISQLTSLSPLPGSD